MYKKKYIKLLIDTYIYYKCVNFSLGDMLNMSLVIVGIVGMTGSHVQGGILALGVMHSDVSLPQESCTVRYPGPPSHAQ